MVNFEHVIGFEWDHGNARKSVEKHDVSQAEAEQIFVNDPLIVTDDMAHSDREPRYHALGRTYASRLLHLTFTRRAKGTRIRIISARDMSRKDDNAMSKTTKPVPSFATEAEERAYWESHDSAEHVDWSKAKRVRMPNLKPSTTSISLRLPVSLLEQIKIAANKRDVPYQSLIKIWLAEKVR